MFKKYLQCPYCRQAITILLDIEAIGFVNIIDNCEVCSRPIEIDYCVEEGEVRAFSYNSVESNEF